MEWANPEKIQAGGLRIWDLQRYQGSNLWNFQGSFFLALEFPRDLTQFFGISRGLALFCLEFAGVK